MLDLLLVVVVHQPRQVHQMLPQFLRVPFVFLDVPTDPPDAPGSCQLRSGQLNSQTSRGGRRRERRDSLLDMGAVVLGLLQVVVVNQPRQVHQEFLQFLQPPWRENPSSLRDQNILYSREEEKEKEGKKQGGWRGEDEGGRKRKKKKKPVPKTFMMQNSYPSRQAVSSHQ